MTRPELMTLLRLNPQPTGTKWGEWYFDGETLRHEDERRCYWIELDDIHEDADVFRWMLHISQKNWGTAECLGNLFKALSDLRRSAQCGGKRGYSPPESTDTAATRANEPQEN